MAILHTFAVTGPEDGFAGSGGGSGSVTVLTLLLRRLVLMILLAAPCSALALSPEPSLIQSVAFEPGSAVLTLLGRKRIAEIIREGSTWPDMQVVVGTEASRNDDVALRSARIDAVVKQLQAEGVFPTRIRIKLEDYDATREGWLRTIEQFRAAGTYMSPVDLTQRTEVTIRITPGYRP